MSEQLLEVEHALGIEIGEAHHRSLAEPALIASRSRLQSGFWRT